MYFLPDGNVRATPRAAPPSLCWQMMVNDFGSAVAIGALARKGNPYFMPKDVQESRADEYFAQPAHDLETFVKVLAYGVDRRTTDWLWKTAPEHAAAWWNEQEQLNATLRDLLLLARQCDYAGLKCKLAVFGFAEIH